MGVGRFGRRVAQNAHQCSADKTDTWYAFVPTTERCMYVRWQRKRRADSDGWGALLTATLVESRRINGKPRQRSIAYLGSIREGKIERVLSHHGFFWRKATTRLDQLDITRGQRDKIETALASRVRRLTDSERAEVNKMLAGYGRSAGQKV